MRSACCQYGDVKSLYSVFNWFTTARDRFALVISSFREGDKFIKLESSITWR